MGAEQETLIPARVTRYTTSVLELHGDLLRASGAREQAQEAYRRSADYGSARAAAKLRTMQMEEAVPDGEAVIRLAEGVLRDGFPGLALTSLNMVAGSGHASRRSTLMLADLYFFYGMVEKGEALYRDLQQSDPRDEAAVRGLDACRQASSLPSF